MSSNKNDAMRRNDVPIEANNTICYMSKTELRMRRYGRSKYAQKLGFGGEKSTVGIPDPDLARMTRIDWIRRRRGRRGAEEVARGRGTVAGYSGGGGRRRRRTATEDGDVDRSAAMVGD